MSTWIQDEMFPQGPQSAAERAAVAVAEELQGRRGFRQNRFDDREDGELARMAQTLVAAIESGATPLGLASIVDEHTAGELFDEDELTNALQEILDRH